ncbi:hypothetical protein NE848_01935 [Gramella jeungdoensis]|uniref:Transposase n=1 Tax=Gramella jeungdoensis TaxID=708091 RepID=A0ABT0YXC2_9FLAO|nr:hypothetical protein [Gramella jeungdoensis]MCM8568117.1 hypothetical protein [Gramella jeungdoensis]
MNSKIRGLGKAKAGRESRGYEYLKTLKHLVFSILKIMKNVLKISSGNKKRAGALF